MKDSIKNVLTTFTLITLFLLGFINFLVMFPAEQGFEFTEQDNDTYATLVKTTGLKENATNSLEEVDEDTETGWKDFDVEVGFMGSNTQKTAKPSVTSYVTNVITTLKVIAGTVFTTTDDGSVHPISVVLGILLSMAGVYLTYLFIKFVRTGY